MSETPRRLEIGDICAIDEIPLGGYLFVLVGNDGLGKPSDGPFIRYRKEKDGAFAIFIVEKDSEGKWWGRPDDTLKLESGAKVRIVATDAID